MSRTKRINNEINKFVIEGKEDELGCWLINHEIENMKFYMNVTNSIYAKIRINYPNDYPWKAPKVYVGK